jgi:hypothetical protein
MDTSLLPIYSDGESITRIESSNGTRVTIQQDEFRLQSQKLYRPASQPVLDGRRVHRLATIGAIQIGRYAYKVYESDSLPRWIVVFGLQWQIIEHHRLEPATDLSVAMAATVERLAAEGWQIEAEPRFGFAFIRRAGERRLLILTPRDPHDTRPADVQPVQVVQ